MNLYELILALAANLAARGDLDNAGRALYDVNDNRVKPKWDQLGDVTKGVWRDRLLQRD